MYFSLYSRSMAHFGKESRTWCEAQPLPQLEIDRMRSVFKHEKKSDIESVCFAPLVGLKLGNDLFKAYDKLFIQYIFTDIITGYYVYV